MGVSSGPFVHERIWIIVGTVNIISYQNPRLR